MAILGIITDFIIKDMLTVESHSFIMTQPLSFFAVSATYTQTVHMSPEPFPE